MDYHEVLVTSGATTPKSPALGEGFKLEANNKQSRSDMTDLVASLLIYFARLLRVHNAKMSALAMKGGMTKYEAVKKRKPNSSSEPTSI